MRITIALPELLYSSLNFSTIKTGPPYLENERCGIIVGRRYNSEKFRITHLIEDNKPSIQKPFQVLRETPHVYPEMIELLKRNEDIDYLGEWHTHPNGPMKASMIDHLSMSEMVNNPEFGELEWVILMIFLPQQKIASYLYDLNHQCNKIECILV